MAAMAGVRAVRMLKSSKDDDAPALEVPEHLANAIKEGNCIAFVGAGFSAAARLPGWAKLLEAILEEGIQQEKISPKLKPEIESMIAEGSSSSFDRAAQIMEDKMGTEMFSMVVFEKLKLPEKPPSAMLERLNLLHAIPFAAILTTNFDAFLPGVPAAHPDAKKVMRGILRDSPLPLPAQIVREFMMGQFYKQEHNWDISGLFPDDEDDDPDMKEINEIMSDAHDAKEDDEDDASEEEEEGGFDDVDFEETIGITPIIQLHGSVANEEFAKDPGLAFTKEGYRHLLHGNASYSKFMTSTMASKTILYLGFSFSDEYINEIRSSIQMMLQQQQKQMDDEDPDDEEEQKKRDRPIAYAISINSKESDIEFYAQHEGVRLLNYVPKDGGPGFEGLEKWLEAIVEETNPLYRWSRNLAGKSVVICGQDNLCGFVRVFNHLAKKKFGVETAHLFCTPPPDKGEDFEGDDIVEFIKESASQSPNGVIDLLLVEYGGPKTPPFPGISFLKALNANPELRCPVLVTDTNKGKRHAAHKKTVMALGAAGYINNFPTLFGQVQHTLRKPGKAGDGGCCVQ